MLYELPDIGLIKIQGNDAKKFLQGQLTCDVEAITAERSGMGAHCNPQGRIISLFYIFQFKEAYYLLMQSSMVPLAIAALKKYAVFFKVEIADASNEMMALGGYNLETNVQNLARIPLSSTRFILAGSPAVLKPVTGHVMPHDQWKSLNIREGIPTLYPETSGKFLPHELNLDKLNAISFDKGCYTGQEIIARMHYRGKLKNRLYLADVSSKLPPQPGADIYSIQGTDMKASGIIVDAFHDMYNNKYQILIVANELNEPLFLNQDLNTVLTFEDNNV